MTTFSPGSRRLCIWIIVFSLMALSACGTTPHENTEIPATAPNSVTVSVPSGGKGTLFEALGGTTGVEKLATLFIQELAADDRIRHHYRKTDIGRFHRMMQLQICELAEGPCVYPGDTMKRTHGGMNIQSAEFNALVEALMRAMNTIGLPAGVQNRLLATMAPMRSDIVGQ